MKRLLKSILGHGVASRLAACPGGPRIVALCYHDLRQDDDFDSWLRISISDFRAHLRALKEFADFIAPESLETRSLLSRTRLNVLLTFDDGYVNNLRLALPILEEMQIPALFFISTGPMVSQSPFRFDVLVTPLQATGDTRVDLSRFGLTEYRLRADRGPGRWHDIDRMLRDIKKIGNDDHPRVAEILQHFHDRYADVLAQYLPGYRPVTVQEIRRMGGHPMVRLGSHAHDHRILTYLDDDQLADSLATSRRILEEHTGRAITDLAYPNGNHDERVAAFARSAGYRRAWTTEAGTVGERSQPYALPRVLLGGYDGVVDLRCMVNAAIAGDAVKALKRRRRQG